MGSDEVVRLPERIVPAPAHLSSAAQASLAVRPPPREYPPVTDLAAWRALTEMLNAQIWQRLEQVNPLLPADAELRSIRGVNVYVATPRAEHRVAKQQIVIDLHGGAFLYSTGKVLEPIAKATALRTGRLCYTPDYRIPPEHPYPAALDDCMSLYRALLEVHRAEDIVVCGTSAGGNLAAAMTLRIRDEGLSMPSGVILLTPEVDLTQSGDTFNTLQGLDSKITSDLMPINLAYAGTADLKDPYLSPLFGDFSRGFPPTMLQAGTRDLFLSNTVRMHRHLRDAGIDAELHVWDAMPHWGFDGACPEDIAVGQEIRRFLASLL